MSYGSVEKVKKPVSTGPISTEFKRGFWEISTGNMVKATSSFKHLSVNPKSEYIQLSKQIFGQSYRQLLQISIPIP